MLFNISWYKYQRIKLIHLLIFSFWSHNIDVFSARQKHINKPCWSNTFGGACVSLLFVVFFFFLLDLSKICTKHPRNHEGDYLARINIFTSFFFILSTKFYYVQRYYSSVISTSYLLCIKNTATDLCSVNCTLLPWTVNIYCSYINKTIIYLFRPISLAVALHLVAQSHKHAFILWSCQVCTY